MANPLDLILRMPHLPPRLQDTFTRMASSLAPNFLPFEKKEVVMERHPIQTLYHFVQRAVRGETVSAFQQRLDAVPEKLRHAIYFEVWNLANDPDKGGDKWG